MLKNYILLAIRNMSRQKISSLIAILGLALGMTSALLLYSFISYHFSYENFMPADSDIKQIISRYIDNKNEIRFSSRAVTRDTALRIREEISAIEEMTILFSHGDMAFSVDDVLYAEDIKYVENNFFRIIPLNLFQGDRTELLDKPDSIVLDTIIAEKYFPGGKALGKNIILPFGDNMNLTVTGVVEIPRNSHLFNEGGMIFMPFKTMESLFSREGFTTGEFRTSVYFKPAEKTDMKILQKQINQLLQSVPDTHKYKSQKLFFEDFDRIHIFSRENPDDARNPLYMIILLIVLTVIILAISIINSVSILTAQSISRTREVGIRQVMGSSKRDLMFQFLTESAVISLFSTVTALIFAELTLPAFSNLVHLNLTLSCNSALIAFILLLTVFIGIISGLYPALYLSSLKVVDSLKGKNLLKLGKSRKILIILQFFFASVILIWTLVINNELSALKKMDVGFNSRNLLSVFPGLNFDTEPSEKLESLKRALKEINGIEAVSHTTYIPFFGGPLESSSYSADDGVTLYYDLYSLIDLDYLSLMEIQTLEGEARENTLVIKKSTSEERGLSTGDFIRIEETDYPVSAVIDDYYIDTPLLGYNTDYHLVTSELFYFQIIRYSGDIDLNDVLGVWKSFYPDKPIEFNFISVEDQNNQDVVRELLIVMNLTIIVIYFIALLGLFGLTLHRVKEKTNEIGIRKVMGAGTTGIIILFIRDSLSLILIALLSGVPLGVLSITFLLPLIGYPFPIGNLFLISLSTAAALLLSGFIFTGLTVIKAARSNPAGALRYE